MSATRQYLTAAEACLAEAREATSPAERYDCAHLAALRAAAAVVEIRPPAVPKGQRRPIRPVWELLVAVAPDLSEWAAFFTRSAVTRAAIASGDTMAVTKREADDLFRDAEVFVRVCRDAARRVA